MKLSVSVQSTDNVHTVVSGKPINCKKWTHVAVVYDLKSIDVYTNGKMEVQMTFAQSSKVLVNSGCMNNDIITTVHVNVNFVLNIPRYDYGPNLFLLLTC